MDALRGLPGIAFQQTTPGQSVVLIRGLKGSEVLHRVDGFRLNNTLFRNAPNQYVALVDALMLEDIDVRRGPAGGLHGSDAMGGVIDLLSAAPAVDAAQPSSGRLRSGYQSADQAWHTRIEGAQQLGDVALMAGLTRVDVGTRRAGGGDPLPFTAYRSEAANAKLLWSPTDTHLLTLQSQQLEQPDTPRHDELVPGFGQTQPASSVFRFRPQTRDFSQLRWQWQADAAAFDQIDLQIGQQRIDDDRVSRDFGSRSEDRERNRSTLSGAALDASLRRGAHHWAYGADVYVDRVRSQRTRQDLDSGRLSPRPSRFPDRSRASTVSAFLAHDWQFRPDWALSWGLRQTAHRVRILEGSTQGVSLSSRDRSGHLGLRHVLRSDTEVQVGLGRGFRSPNVFDLGVFGDRPGNRFSLPNPDLGAESIRSIDLGLRWHSSTWDLDVSLFRSLYEDKIVAIETGEVTDSGRIVVQNRNLSRLDLQGIEFGGGWHPGPDFELQASLSLARGTERLQREASPADRIPPLNGRIEARWTPRPRHTLRLRIDYAARQDRLSLRDRIDPRIDPAGSPGWITHSLGWEHSHGALRWMVELANLGDRRYREHGSGVDARGRSLGVSVDWRF